MRIEYNNTVYGVDIIQADENLQIIIFDFMRINKKASVEYIPCGDKRFDYKICENSGLTIADIEEILEIVTERIYND